MTRERIRLVLVEDSATQAAHLARVLQADGDITVVAQVADGDRAVEAVAHHRPDVVTMDLDLPGAGGEDAIERIMSGTPTPILVLSGVIDGSGSAQAVAALAAGAVDALPKPQRWDEATERALRRQVRTVASVPVVGRRRRPTRTAPLRQATGGHGPVVAIAASTGGPAALAELLRALPAVPAPLLVVQHIHASFTAAFVTWLDAEAAVPVELATGGVLALPAHVYVAPSDVHLRLGAHGRLTLHTEPRSVHRPSADELFFSLAERAGPQAVGVCMTGMGDDGARGLLAMRRAGARTFGQDEASSVVFGMPRAAHELGAVQRLMPPVKLAAAVAAAVREMV